MSYKPKLMFKSQPCVFVDNKLSSLNHINQFALNLSKCNGMINKLCKYVNRETLLLLYYSLEYPYIRYRITVWGTAVKSLLYRIEVGQNNILRMISWSTKYCQATKLHKSFAFKAPRYL